MTDLPPGWEWATLGEVAESVKNGIYVSRPGVEPDGVPILRISAVRSLALSMDDLRYSSRSADDLKATDALVEPGDLLFTRYSGSRALVGVCARMPEGLGELTFPDKLIRVRLPPGIDSKYVAHAFTSPRVRSRVEAVLRTTAGQVGIAGRELKRVQFPLAPLSEQRRVVGELEDHLSRIEHGDMALGAVSNRLDLLRRSALEAITEEGSMIGSSTMIGDMCDVRTGIQKQPSRRPKKNSYPFLRVANVPRGGLHLADVHQVELFKGEIDRYRLRSGDLLVVEGNGSPDQIGRAAIWREEIADCVHQNHLIRVRPGPLLDAKYLELIWN